MPSTLLPPFRCQWQQRGSLEENLALLWTEFLFKMKTEADILGLLPFEFREFLGDGKR